MAQKPPVFKLPPPKTKKQQTAQSVYRDYINAHPGMAAYAQPIWQAARRYNVDPVYFASMLWTEGFAEAHRRGVPVATIRSSAGAIGPGQIMPLHVGEPIPWAPGRKVTEADLENPGFNIRWSAYYFSTKLQRSGGNYDTAYRGKGGYNPGGPRIFTDIPKGYVPLGGAPSPQQQAQNTVEQQAATKGLEDPWVAYNPKTGAIRFVNAASPPNGVLTSAGLPVRRSDFMQAWRSLNDVYFSYTGKPASQKAVANYLRSPTSTYQLEARLSKLPSFTNSPLYKSQAPSYKGVWASIYGESVPPDQNLLRYAIVHNLGAEGFQQLIRKSKQYLTSSEFKGATASLTNVYQTIYGNPDDTGMVTIKNAAVAGWSPDQFAAYLRAQPEYTSSSEYHTKRLSFLDALGVTFGGGPPILVPGGNPANTNPSAGKLPTDPRVKGNMGPNVSATGGMVAHG